jgi:hypothetical protein
VLTAVTESLSSAHQTWYKRHSSDPAFFSDHISQSVIHTWSRATGLWSHWLYTAPGTAASALRWSCPTHRTTGCLDSPVATPHTLGNWSSCRMPPLQQLRSATRRLPATRLHNQAATQLLHCDQATATLLPANQHSCATSANSYFYQAATQLPHCDQATNSAAATLTNTP